MWAVSRQSITCPRATALLDEHKHALGLHSNLWLLEDHLLHFGCTLSHLQGLVVYTDFLKDQPPLAYPLCLAPRKLLETIKKTYPPPPTHGQLPPLLMERDGHFSWRQSTPEEYVSSTLYGSIARKASARCLVEPHLVKTVPNTGQAIMWNAQQTSNPFQIDPALAHYDVVTGKALPDSLNSGLTMVAAQFGYISFQWLEDTGALESAHLIESDSHIVTVSESVTLAHLSQLHEEHLHELFSCIPRYVLCNALQVPYIHSAGRWHKPAAFGLSHRLTTADVPASIMHRKGLPPLLWVDMDRPVRTGKLLVRYRHLQKRFFNASQIMLK